MTQPKSIQAQGGEIVLYRAPDGRTNLDVRLDRDTLWLSQAQMAELVGKDVDAVGLHIRNACRERELSEPATCEDFSVVRQEGRRRVTR